MSVESRAADIKTRLRNDMAKTLRESGWSYNSRQDFPAMLDALMEDALHQIEPLLIEVDAMQAVFNTLDARIREKVLPGPEHFDD